MTTYTSDLITTLAADNQIDQEIFRDLQKQVQQMTRAFISMCISAYLAKATCERSELKAMTEALEWTGSTLTPYAKVGQYIVGIEVSNLELLDCNTIKALCCEKYKPILERLKSERLTVAEVREEMKNINQSVKKEQPAPRVLEWKRRKTGEHSLIIRLEDVEAGREFEAKLKESTLPLPLFVRNLLRLISIPIHLEMQTAPHQT